MSSPKTQTGPNALHPVPLTLEGSSVLHQMMRFRWTAWRQLPEAKRSEIARQAAPDNKTPGRRADVIEGETGHKRANGL